MKTYQKTINGKEMQIADYEGKGGTIVAIHGLTGTHKNMRYYANKFKGDYRFVAMDLRGRGNSAALDPVPSIYNHAEDILALIQELDIQNSILLGHSMGAFISAIVASKLDSVKGVILLDGAAEMSNHQRDIVKPSLARLSKKYSTKEQYLEEVKNIYQNLGVTWNKELADTTLYEVEPVGDHWASISNEGKILADFESFYSFDPKKVCSSIGCPVLLVYAKSKIGEMPPLFYLGDYDKTVKSIEEIQTVISDCNHYTMVFENREDINGFIVEFLQKIKG
jgi:pimeloyl-ACP methyl ester carboxylesterase